MTRTRTITAAAALAMLAALASCVTTDLESAPLPAEPDERTELESAAAEEAVMVEELLKENDMARSVIVLEPPEVRHAETGDDEPPGLTGEDALKEHLEDATVLPEYEDGRLRGWLYRDGAVYQVQCQTYHSTLIQLEPGEEMTDAPFISEPDVWRISRGVGVKGNQSQHYLVIKPDYSGLVSTLIVVTNRRTYLMELRSYKDRWMPLVRWAYPRAAEDSESWLRHEQQKLTATFSGVSPETLSFDYKMRHPVLNKPAWLPKQVYDDGRKTYIVLSEQSLTTEYPVLLNERNRIINYRTKDNLMIIDQLIEKVTLRLGRQKVTIEKKKARAEDTREAGDDDR